MTLTGLALDRILKGRPKLRPFVVQLVWERLNRVERPSQDFLVSIMQDLEDDMNFETANGLARLYEYRGMAEGLAIRLPFVKGDRFASAATDALDLICMSLDGDDKQREERAAQSERLIELVKHGRNAPRVATTPR